jgi:ClpP class serine protease
MKSWASILTLLLAMSAPAAIVLGDDPKEARADESAEKEKPKESSKKESPIRGLAELRLDQFVVPARAINLPLPGRIQTVQDILEKLERWSKDEKIGGVLLDVDDLAISISDVEELRAGIKKMREGGKRVVAFLNAGGPEAYLLSCAADEIAIAPTGGVVIPGLGRLFPFLQGYFQMIGLEFQVITAGRFK